MLHFPGHTEGSIVLYWGEHGGVVLAGDSAVAPGPQQGLDSPRLVRPPAMNAEADGNLRELWRNFGEAHKGSLPATRDHVCGPR